MAAKSPGSSLMARTVNMGKHEGEVFNCLFNCTLLNGSPFNFERGLTVLNDLSFPLVTALRGGDDTSEVAAYQDGEPSAERR